MTVAFVGQRRDIVSRWINSDSNTQKPRDEDLDFFTGDPCSRELFRPREYLLVFQSQRDGHEKSEFVA